MGRSSKVYRGQPNMTKIEIWERNHGLRRLLNEKDNTILELNGKLRTAENKIRELNAELFELRLRGAEKNG